jgi:hypothetical protein
VKVMLFPERHGRDAERGSASPDRPAADEQLGDECEAFLEGHYLRYAEAEGLPLRPWMWLNRLAHGSRLEVARAAGANPCGGWDEVVPVLAQALLAATSPDDFCTVQADALVPLELALVDHDVTPRRMIELATNALYGANRPEGR